MRLELGQRGRVPAPERRQDGGVWKLTHLHAVVQVPRDGIGGGAGAAGGSAAGSAAGGDLARGLGVTGGDRALDVGGSVHG